MSNDRTTISLPNDVYEEASEHKGDRTWAEVVRDGAYAEGRREHPASPRLETRHIPELADAIAEEVVARLEERGIDEWPVEDTDTSGLLDRVRQALGAGGDPDR